MKILLLAIYLLITDYSDWVAVSEPPDLRACYTVYKCEDENIEYWYIIQQKTKIKIGKRQNNSKVILWDRNYQNCK